MLVEVEEAVAKDGRTRPNLVVVPTGVGALAAAVARHFWSAPGERPLILAVEPTSAACVLESVAAGGPISLDHPQTSMMAGLNCGSPSAVAWPTISRGIDVYLAASEARVPHAMRLLARDGIQAGETGAAALAGMLELVSGNLEAARTALGVGAESHVLLLCTEGATDPDAYRRHAAG
jgi:diaminopropionate ammonia-lyase